MKLILFTLLFLCATVSSNYLSNLEATKSSLGKSNGACLDSFLVRFLDQPWTKEEQPCVEKILVVIENLRNFTLWATWTWDSMQLPAGQLYGVRYHLGNYDQCMDIPWASSHPELLNQYCLADVTMATVSDVTMAVASNRINVDIKDPFASTAVYVNSTTQLSRAFELMTMGLCLPAVCQNQSVAKFTRAFLLTSHFSRFVENATISVDSCQVPGPKNYFPIKFFVFIGVFALLLLTAIFCTYYVRSKEGSNDNSIGTAIAKAFCMRTNTSELTNMRADGLECIYGMRAFTSGAVVLGHQWLFMNWTTALVNGAGHDRLLYEKMWLFFHTDIFVDAFFMLAGLLAVKSFISLCNSNRPFNPIKNIVKRYVRLMGVFIPVLAYMLTVHYYVGDGPLWPRLSGYEERTCRDTWWLSLLMLSNYVRSNELCYYISWYVAADFHMFIATMLIFCVYRLNRKSGIFVFWLFFLSSHLAPGLETYYHAFRGAPVFDQIAFLDLRKNEQMLNTYIRSHNRAGPHFVGMLMGYIIAHYKPNQYKNTFSKAWSIFGTILSAALMFSILIISDNIIFGEYNALTAAFFAALNRSLWVVGVCGVLACCAYGEVPIVNAFLSWSIFVPISRLSYGLYLIHEVLLFRKNFSTRTLLKYDPVYLATDMAACMVLGLIMSYVVWLLFDAPINNLTGLILDGIPKPKTEKQETKSESKSPEVTSVNYLRHNGLGFGKQSQIVKNLVEKYEPPKDQSTKI